MNGALLAAFLVVVALALTAVLVVVVIYGRRFETLVAGERAERAVLLRAILARTPGEFVSMDRAHADGQARVLAAQRARLSDDDDPAAVAEFARAVRADLQEMGLDVPPLVPEGM